MILDGRFPPPPPASIMDSVNKVDKRTMLLKPRGALLPPVQNVCGQLSHVELFRYADHDTVQRNTAFCSQP